MSNGIYWVITSFLLTTIVFFIQTIKSDGDPNPYYAASLLFLFVCFLITVVLDFFMLQTRRLIYISRSQIVLTLSILLVLFIDINSMEISILITFIHCIYRMLIHRNIEYLELDSKYDNIIKLLNLTNQFISVKGEFKNYITYIKDKDISFDGDYSLFFKNKKVRFDVIKQLQIEFSKPFISFDAEELQVAEMYSIQ